MDSALGTAKRASSVSCIADAHDDPRRGGAAVRPWKETPPDMDQLPPDYMSLLSLMLGLLAYLLTSPILAWTSVFFCLSSLANMKASQVDAKQNLCTLSCVLFGLLVNHSSCP
mmetsp:Transcript_11465/g.22528  ORF Transcript_11465/g.22528 Transcript_11465/m.22528 type:complete len:113 (+) Transcript_11465:90-428(+)